MQTNSHKPVLNSLARRLIQEALISESVAMEAIETARSEDANFISHLVENKLVAARDIAMNTAHDFGIPVFDLAGLDKEYLPYDLMDEELVEKFRALPIRKCGQRLFIAISDPTNVVALDEFKFRTGLHTEAVIVEDDKLSSAIESALQGQSLNLDEGLEDDLDSLDVDGGKDQGNDDGDAKEADETPIVRFVNKVLLDAINRGASDIHVEPYEHLFRIRYRIDGILHEITKPPLVMASRLIARLKVMSRMDISERRIPQDGRIKLKLSKTRAIDFRVNTCPTLFGEKVVLRILDPSSAQLGIDMLGYEPEQKQCYMDALANPYGMILVTGPTGSGKTVSLYTGLNILNTPETNISTAEDPAEINLTGINQVNVNPKAGLTFAEALKAFLRQDPDVIMVGEIRDLETASIAVKAAQTGHLVLSTLHTNDAPQTLTRLMNIGIPAYNIASAVSLIIAQRLGRRLCENCKTEDDIPQQTLIDEGFTEEQLKDLTVYKAQGCDKCTNGYKGRVGIYQVMPISEPMERIIMANGTATEIADQAATEGIADLRQSALKKVMQGVLSLEEANRVTKD